MTSIPEMHAGDIVKTPRFLNVKIQKVYESHRELERAGFREPTHYDDGYYVIQGKHTGENKMQFACSRNLISLQPAGALSGVRNSSIVS